MKLSLWSVGLIWLTLQAEAFQFPAFPNHGKCLQIKSNLHAQQQPEDRNLGPGLDQPETEEDNDKETLSEADARLSDILPPTVSFSRNSVLFSDNPVTQRNNEVLTFWRGFKSMVPPVVTGAWPWRDPHLADENPMGALYNIAFVRLPVIVMGLVYAKNLKEGHPLIMDYGDGPMEINPLAVFIVLAIILA